MMDKTSKETQQLKDSTQYAVTPGVGGGSFVIELNKYFYIPGDTVKPHNLDAFIERWKNNHSIDSKLWDDDGIFDYDRVPNPSWL